MMKAAEVEASAHVDGMAKDLGRLTGDKSTTMKISLGKSLGVLDEHDNSIAMASIGPMTASDKEGEQKFDQVMAMALVRVHGKPLDVCVYSDFDSQADVEWAENQVRARVRRVRALNP